jgi:hypothetical protein
MPGTDDDRSGHAADIKTAIETPGVQQKAMQSIQLSALPVAETSRNQSFHPIVSVKNRSSSTVSLKEYTGFNQHVQFNPSTPPPPPLLSVTNSTATGQTVFRKLANNVVPMNGNIQSASRNSNLYTNNVTMPVVVAVNRTAEKNIISRTVDAGAAASNESLSTSAAQADRSEPVVPSVTDELIDKIFSRLLRRIAVESERRGWRF